MNTAISQARTDVVREKAAAKVVRNGLLIGDLAGAIAVILTIIGLLNIRPELMVPLAVIALGAAFLFEGGVIGARFRDFLTETNKARREVFKLESGVTIEVIGGAVGAILGILALLNLMPAVLVSSAVVVYGVTLIIGSGVASWFDSLLKGRSGEHEPYGTVAHQAVVASVGIRFVLGVTAVVLGIISLLGISPIAMNLAALLCVSVSSLLTDSAISAGMWSIMQRTAA